MNELMNARPPRRGRADIAKKPLMRLCSRSQRERALRDAARVAFDPSQHLSPIRVHRDRSRRRSRARRVENSRGAVKRKRERFARRTHVASLNPITPRYILEIARFIVSGASSRRVSISSRSIADEERSFFRSRAFVFAENVPVRGSALNCHGIIERRGHLSTSFQGW